MIVCDFHNDKSLSDMRRATVRVTATQKNVQQRKDACPDHLQDAVVHVVQYSQPKEGSPTTVTLEVI